MFSLVSRKSVEFCPFRGILLRILLASGSQKICGRGHSRTPGPPGKRPPPVPAAHWAVLSRRRAGGPHSSRCGRLWAIEQEPAPIADVILTLQDPEFQLHLQGLQAERQERELLGEEPEKVRQWFRAELQELLSWYGENVQRWTTTD